jgi:hypothetical protein
MRGNGLSAEAYIAVADLDPRTADLLLAELAERGVAAYAADSPDPGPRGQVDRLYVDASAEEVVRSMIDRQLDGTGGSSGPGAGSAAGTDDPGELDIDSAFADIVAGFHQTDAPGVGRWSADEDLDGGPGVPGAPGVPGSPAAPRPLTGPTSSHVGWDDVLRPEPMRSPEAAEPVDPEDRYIPPPPPPLPRGDRVSRAAWAAVIGGPGLLFAAAIFGWQLDPMVLLVAAAAFLAGFVTLVARLKDRPDEDGDDGAVV